MNTIFQFVMKVLLLPILTTLITSTSPASFGEAMEKEIPGSLEYLARWALMEKTIDKLELIFRGKQPPPRGDRDVRMVAYYTLSTNPDMLEEEFQHHMVRIFKTSNLVPSTWRLKILEIFSVPRWLFTEMFVRKHSSVDHKTTLRDIVLFVRDRMQSNPDSRFSDDPSIRTTVMIWWLFGLPASPEATYPAQFDPTTDSYIMTSYTKTLALQHMSFHSLR